MQTYLRALLTAGLFVGAANAQVTVMMSQDASSGVGNADSIISSTRATSEFGRWTAFASAASDLVAGDSNNAWDVFVRDRAGGATVRVSVSSSGAQAIGDSGWGGVAGTSLGGVAISPLGRYVVFPSRASGLVTGASNVFSDIYVHDRDADADGVYDEPAAVSTARVSVSTTGGDPNGNSFQPSISDNGVVVFASDASNLVPADANNTTDVFAWSGAAISRISLDTSGADPDGPSNTPLIAAGGEYVVFSSDATDLITSDTNTATDVFALGLTSGALIRLSEREDGTQASGPSRATSISHAGDLVVFESASCNLIDSCSTDTNGVTDVYLVDRDSDGDFVLDEPGDRVFTLVSVTNAGAPANGASFGGSINAYAGLQPILAISTPIPTVVAFRSAATNLTAAADPDGTLQNFFQRDVIQQTTTHVGTLPGGGRALATGAIASEVSVSTEGGMIAFTDFGAAPRQAYLFDGQVLDTDADSLLDSWEIAGIDANADGTTDLAPLGTSPWMQDVIIEVDAMQGRLPSPRTLQLIQSMFGQTDARSVRLTLIIDETNIPPQTWSADINPITWPTEFTPFKNAWFGSAAERASPNWPNIRQAKLWAHRYCVFADQNVSNTIAGMAEMPGNDMFLTLGGIWSWWGANPAVQIGVFMHELGHTLNLNHGGGPGITNAAQRAIEYKPNYPSVVNPTWTTPQTGYASSWFGNLTESTNSAPSSLPPIFIDESQLFEAEGIGGYSGFVVPVGPPPMRLVNQTGGVDWDRDGACCLPFPGVSADTNFLAPGMGGPSPNQPLFSHNDYANIQVQIGRTGSFASSAHGTSLPSDEYTYQDFQTLESVGDWDDKLDNYALGEPLYAIGGWETWCDGGQDALVSDEFALSPPNSIKIFFDGSGELGSDIVKRFEEDSGRLVLSTSVYVPSTATGEAYVVGLNRYCEDGHNWSLQVEFNATEGVVRDFDGAVLPLAYDRWAEFWVEIDLDADLYSMFYDGIPLAEGLVWSQHVSGSFGDPGLPRLRALNLYAEDITEMYFDNLYLARPDRHPPEVCAADLAEPVGQLDFSDVIAFLTAYAAMEPQADLAEPFGVFDFSDVIEFLTVFGSGCP